MSRHSINFFHGNKRRHVIRRHRTLQLMMRMVTYTIILTRMVKVSTTKQNMKLLYFRRPSMFTSFLQNGHFIRTVTRGRQFTGVVRTRVTTYTLRNIFALAMTLSGTLRTLNNSTINMIRRLSGGGLTISTIHFIRIRRHVNNNTKANRKVGSGVNVFYSYLGRTFGRYGQFQVIRHFKQFEGGIFGHLHSIGDRGYFFDPCHEGLSTCNLVFSGWRHQGAVFVPWGFRLTIFSFLSGST